MKQQAIDILKSMQEGLRIEQGMDEKKHKWGILERKQTESDIALLETAISRISALGDGWIPVTERLPHDDEEYIVCTSDGLVTSVAWSTDENNWIVGITNWRTDIFGKITHWMPLPLLPVTK